jgi:transcriptional regulator with XRE-family HTH domain
MTFNEKLRRLLKNMNITAVARDAGVKRNTVESYLKRGSVPNIEIANALAGALGVEVGWLVNPDENWPPARVDTEEPSHTA